MIDVVTTATDHAAAQSDRWLFVALLIVGTVAALVAGRWLASRYEAMLETWRSDMKAMQAEIAQLHTERITAADRHAEELRTLVKQQTDDAKAMLRDFAGIAARNAEVLGAVTKALSDLQASCTLVRSLNRPNP